MLERLRAVIWTGDWDDAVAHVMSRRILMREYLRRAGMWAQAYSAEAAWPFFDVTEYMDSQFTLPSELAKDLQTYLNQLTGDYAIKRTCSGAVRIAEFREQDPAFGADLPDLYEPLVLFYERGGEFLRDNAGFIDLTGVSLRPGTLQGHLSTPRLDSLDDAVLDAVDAEGRITYYTAANGQGTLMRKRAVQDAQHNEAFNRGTQRWEPAGTLPASADTAADFGLIWLDEVEAANLIARTVATSSS